MSDFQDYQGTNVEDNNSYSEEKRPELFDGITYKGEKTDFRFDPGAAVKKTWINYNKPVNLVFADKSIELSPKTDQSRLAFLSKNTETVRNEEEKIPSNQGYAERVGFRNPDALAMAIEHYAATEEYIRNMEAEAEEEE